jgi:hypothetical protein
MSINAEKYRSHNSHGTGSGRASYHFRHLFPALAGQRQSRWPHSLGAAAHERFRKFDRLHQVVFGIQV